MAYCLRSFVETLDHILHPDKHHKNWVLDPDHKPQIQSFFENASFLQDFLDESSPLILQGRIASLEDRIMEAAEIGANTLESYITSQILSSPEGQSFTISPPDLGQVLRAFEVARQEVIKIQPVNHATSPPVSSTRYPDSKNVTVGVTEVLNQLRSRLTSARVTKLDVIPIVGMGGMGKTTLARILYDEFSASKSHFDYCAWVTVSQSYNPQQILQTLLGGIEKHSDKMLQQGNADLIVTLHKTLFGRRYLIVLDDVWSCEAWDDFRRAFPDDNKGSRIILTTRENNVANYVNSSIHQMHALNEGDSWELVRKKVFGELSCPNELEEVGKRIALKCGGLPLALKVIGGLLSQSEKSYDFWEHVAYNVSSSIEEADDQFSGIFSWSFAHLPHYLKPCFLYMGAFPEDHKIKASKIIKLWVAEGFLKAIGDKSIEEVAEIHLKALVDRNLIFVRGIRRNRKAKSYGIHDLLRDLCLKKAQEKFLYHVKDNNPQEDMLSICRVSVHSSPKHLPSLKLTPHARSFLNIHVVNDKIISCLCFKLSLLRVLDLFGVKFGNFPELILQLVNLRYLDVYARIPRSISMLRNLQTLIARDINPFAAIADLPQLRHLIVNSVFYHCFCDKCSGGGDCCPFDVHENLRTLSKISFSVLDTLCGKLPNLRKLETYNSWYDDLIDLTCFYNLETLKLERGSWRSISKFPCSLKKLTFFQFQLTQSLLDAIGMLPNLQILILESCQFLCTCWETCEGGFRELQYLHINSAENLKNWSATESDFPVLRRLVVGNCNHLNEIPSEIGEIVTLEIIEVAKCKLSVLDSARTILDEQRKLGNTIFQLWLGGELEMDKNHGLSLAFYTISIETILPHFLRNLTLEFCRVPKTLLSANDDLPEFKVLNIENCHFESSTWEPFEGVFFQLQYLKIVESNLKNWLATKFHFPVLRHLVIRGCRYLTEIPKDLGGIKTLEIIEVEGCRLSVFESARRILEEQHQFGNSRLQLRLGCETDVRSSDEEEDVRSSNEEDEVEYHGLSFYDCN